MVYIISIMRPNTPHLVITPTHSICYRGHFYATSIIRDTCYRLFHMFIGSSVLMNMEHTKDSHILLWQILTMYHVLFTQQFSDSGQLKISTAYP